MDRQLNHQFLKYVCCWEFFSSLGEMKSELYTHLLLLIAMLITMLLFMLPELDETSRSLPCCRLQTGEVADICEFFPGTLVVIRLSSVFVTYFLIIFIVEMILIKRKDSCIAARRSFWAPKVIVIALICYGCLYIKPNIYDRFWAFIFLIGSSMYVLIQLYTIIRTSYLGLIFLQNLVDSGSKPAHRLQISLFVIGIFLSILFQALLIYYYPLCGLNIAFLVTNAFIPTVASLWSTSDCVRERNGYSGFLSGSILTCYVLYWTWSAFSSNPDPNCNPYSDTGIGLILVRVFTVIFAVFIYIINTHCTYEVYVDDQDDSTPFRRVSGNSLPINSASENESAKKDRKLVINTLFCYFIRAPLISYVVMVMMDWAPISTGFSHEERHTIALWFKIGSSWMCTLFYIVTLYIPSIYGIRKKTTLIDKD